MRGRGQGTYGAGVEGRRGKNSPAPTAKNPPKLGGGAPRPNVCGLPRVMKSSDHDCWRLAGECSRWAEEAQDRATRAAFRQMATAWSQLAFGHHFKRPAAKSADENFSLATK